MTPDNDNGQLEIVFYPLCGTCGAHGHNSYDCALANELRDALAIDVDACPDTLRSA